MFQVTQDGQIFRVTAATEENKKKSLKVLCIFSCYSPNPNNAINILDDTLKMRPIAFNRIHQLSHESFLNYNLSSV